MDDERDVARVTSHYPLADITPAEFEMFVMTLLESVASTVEALEVTRHETVEGVDGVYEFDVTVRFRFAGMDFLVLVEAKRHTSPIKRELVQVLHSKLQGVGAQKAVMAATAPYQRGALRYAKTHGIALVTVTEGRFIYETRSIAQTPTLSRREARERQRLPDFVGHSYASADQPGATRITLLDETRPEGVVNELLGVPTSRPAWDCADVSAGTPHHGHMGLGHEMATTPASWRIDARRRRNSGIGKHP